MRGTCIVLIVSALLIVISTGAQAATIQEIVNQISPTSFQSYLSDTLPTHNGNNRAFNMGVSGGVVRHGVDHDVAAESIYTAFRRSGWLTQYDPFTFNDDYGVAWSGRNVVAVKQGTTRPDDIYIIGSHYDSISNHESGWTTAPGADDNGSGIAGLLEMARVLSPYAFDATIVFAAFDGEEVTARVDGTDVHRLGSMHYAAEHADDNILGMVSSDMIAWATPYSRDPDTGEDLRNKADIEARTNMTTIVSQLSAAIRTYGGGLQVDVRGNPGDYSDHVSFADRGFQAVQFIEDGWWNNPNYHCQSDSVDMPGYLNYTYATNMLKSVTGYVCTGALTNPAGGAQFIPEPGCFLIITSGIAGMVALCRRRRSC